MRMAIIPATLLLFLSLSKALAVEAGTGNALLESCRSLLNPAYNAVIDLQRNLDNPSGIVAVFDLHLTRGMCLGMIGGVRSLMDAERTAPPGPIKRACIPIDVSNGQLVRVVVSFMERHPELLNYELPALAIVVLAETWPCQQNTPASGYTGARQPLSTTPR